MLKFDLARKYLVGLLTVAMVFSLFVLPASAAPDATVNAGAELELKLALDDYDGTVTSTTVPDLTLVNGYLTIKLGGVLTDTNSVCYRVVQNGTVTDTGEMTRDSTGKYSFSFSDTDTTYTVYAWTDTNTNGALDAGEPLSNPVTITWYTPALGSISVDPTVATNTVPADHEHTITITLKDQYGADFEATQDTTVSVKVNGLNKQTKTVTILEAESSTTFTYTDTSTLSDWGTPIYKTGTDTLVFTCGNKTATATKFWVTETSTSYSGYMFNPESGTYTWNYVGDPHTVGLYFVGANGGLYTGTVTYDLTFKVTGTNSITQKSSGTTKAGKVEWTYTSEEFGWDDITVTGTITAEGNPYSINYEAHKLWIYPFSVSPMEAVNLIGSEHTFYFTGAPYDTVYVNFSSAGVYDFQNLYVTGINDYHYTVPRHVTSYSWEVPLDETGTGSITVLSQAPGKFFLDATFEPGYLSENEGWIWSSYLEDQGLYDDREPETIKAAKCYAELTKLDITPKEEINPITQTSWDTHTVTVTVLGEYPVKPATVVPPTDPPLGGTYKIVDGILWVVDAPIANVSVDWKVSWTDTVVARLPSSGLVKASTYYFTARGTSDENGEAALTYKLNWTGLATGIGSCQNFFSCLVDSIAATAGYGVDVLDQEYGTITETATKEWRDYPFKLIKYNGHVPIGPGDYIPGAQFFLKLYNPTITGTTGTVTYMIPLGNAYQQLDPTKPWLVTTDTVGVAIFFHLPYGTYELWEYYAPDPYGPLDKPVKTDITFTIDKDTTWWWCNPTGEKIKTEYYVNTPTNPYFYKVTYCGTKVVGAVFDVTNLTTGEKESFTSDANGKVVIDLSLFSPAFSSIADTVYKVHEVSTGDATDVYPVADFYFKLNKAGGWNSVYYADEDCTVVGWKSASYSWAWYTGSRLWVIDPKIGTTPVQPVETTLDLMKGWNLVGVGLDVTDTVKNLFGPNFIRAFRWDPTLPGPETGSSGSYFSFDNNVPEPGKGFWVKMAAAGEVTIEGLTVGSPVSFDLTEGWEMIANPFDEEIPWTNVTIDGMSMADAYAAGIIGRAFSWNGTTYAIADFATGTLGVGQGFWLRVKADCTIEFTK